MPLIDFVIGNPGHHLAAVRPVVRRLARRGELDCRILSLCELRGFATPAAALRQEGLAHRRLVPGRLRSPSSFPQRRRNGGGPGGIRRTLHGLSWHLLLRPRLWALQRARPDLVVLPNDSAFPYDRLARALNTRRIPFLLLQEGIRFPLPSGGGDGVYGTGGAAAIAAWGESSAEYFRAQGVDDERIFLTGSPRLESDLQRDWSREAAALRRRLGAGGDVLLFLSNPIDDQGFCTTHEKLELFERFVAGLSPLLEAPGFHLVVKLHGRENPVAFRAAAARAGSPRGVVIVEEAPLHALFRLAKAAVILASTVGLEALACGLPLGVLEIPGHGFVFDFVSSGAARGLRWSDPLAEQVQELMSGNQADAEAAARYLRHSLARTAGAAEHLAGLIETLVP